LEACIDREVRPQIRFVRGVLSGLEKRHNSLVAKVYQPAAPNNH